MTLPQTTRLIEPRYCRHNSLDYYNKWGCLANVIAKSMTNCFWRFCWYCYRKQYRVDIEWINVNLWHTVDMGPSRKMIHHSDGFIGLKIYCCAFDQSIRYVEINVVSLRMNIHYSLLYRQLSESIGSIK